MSQIPEVWTPSTFEPDRGTRLLEAATLLTDLDLAGIDATGHISAEGRRDAIKAVSYIVDSLALMDRKADK